MARQHVEDLIKIIEYPKSGIMSKVVCKGDLSNYTLMCLAAGTDISEHTSTREGSVLVLEGKGMFSLNQVQIKLEPGTFIFMPKDAPHSLKADTNLAFLLSLSGRES